MPVVVKGQNWIALQFLESLAIDTGGQTELKDTIFDRSSGTAVPQRVTGIFPGYARREDMLVVECFRCTEGKHWVIARSDPFLRHKPALECFVRLCRRYVGAGKDCYKA